MHTPPRLLSAHAPALATALLLTVWLGGPPPARAAQKYAFVTSVTGTGNLSSWPNAGGHTGVAAGDAICQARAFSGGLGTPGNFVAWISSSTSDAYCRVHGFSGKKLSNCGQAQLPTDAGPWVRPDGYPFGANLGAMIADGEVYAPVRMDEFGNGVSADYFTGNNKDGTVLEFFSPPCGDWTSSSGSAQISLGSPLQTADGWSYSGSATCSQSRAILCLEAGAGPPLDPFGAHVRDAFVTESTGNGRLGDWTLAGDATGVAAGDAICRAEAALGGRSHVPTFKAWLSDGSTNAADRFVSNNAWTRVDGVPVALIKANLTNGNGLFSPLNQTALGDYIGNSVTAWTGTLSTGLKSPNTCFSWTSSSSSFIGEVGEINDASTQWTDYGLGKGCDTDVNHLYCLADGARLNQPGAAATIGSTIALTGDGITAGSVLKVFVATSSGPVDVAPDGINPTNVTSTSWTGTLPWPWPVGGANAKLMGNGFVSLALVQKDLGYDMSEAVGAVLHGSDAKSVPTILSLDLFLLSNTSSDPSVGTANVEHVIPVNHSMAIGGSGFSNAVVNVFTASGNIGPLTPTTQTSTSINVTIPANAPIGPGSIQVVNGGTFQPSNAVSVPIGEAITVTSVGIVGSQVTVNGTGFNALTVINLFANSSGVLTNAGGLNPNGTSKIPLTIVNSHQLKFTRPAGLDAGGAYVQAINPPFIPYTSSGSGAGGSFTLP